MVYGMFGAKVVLNYLTDRHSCNQRKQYKPLTAAVMAEVVLVEKEVCSCGETQAIQSLGESNVTLLLASVVFRVFLFVCFLQ